LADRSEVTQLLANLRTGDRSAEERLLSLVYAELRRLAAFYMRKERADHTLQPTALVHEAYLRLTKLTTIDWQSGSHFFAMAASLMRRILVDYARANNATKRRKYRDAVSLDEALIAVPERSSELLALDEALTHLNKLNERQAKIVELKFFAGLDEEEIGEILGVSARTVKRDWRLAKAWLYHQMHKSSKNSAQS
jgi:RNA polymerase sigma factor (TIGR02999 family)